jgi:hypothetical protein
VEHCLSVLFRGLVAGHYDTLTLIDDTLEITAFEPFCEETYLFQGGTLLEY